MPAVPEPPVASAPPDVSTDGEMRLHPWSWLFVLLTQLRPMILPLLVLVVFGRGDRWELFGVAAAVILSLYALIYSIGFRYRLQGDELIVREGILNRTERHIPIGRIHNVVQRRNPLHRFFGVTELRLESAGGSKPEAVMNVIARAEADRLERVLREGVAHPVDSGAADAEVPEVLHALGLGDLVRLGISSNRGLVALAALWAASWQFDFDLKDTPFISRLLGGAKRTAWDFIGDHGAISVALAALVMLALLWTMLRVLSVAIAIVTFYDFRLERQGRRLVSDSGLLTRTRAGATPRRIQRVTVRQGWMLARMRRVSVQVTLAGGVARGGEKETRLRWLAPIATVPAAQRILAEVRPDADWLRDDWMPLHPRAAWRMFKWPALFVSIGLSVLGLINPNLLWAAPLVLTWLWLDARGRAKFGGYVMDKETFAVRDGWLARRWDSVRLRDIQSVRFMQTPGDRRQGMARVAVASAGSSDLVGSPVEVACLATAEAAALCDRLREVASQPTTETGLVTLL